MNKLGKICFIGFLLLSSTASAQEIAAYAVTEGKTSCKAGSVTDDTVAVEGDITFNSGCDDKTGDTVFTMMGISPEGEFSTVTIDEAIFVEAQIGLMDNTGTGTPESFPYYGKASPDSYVLLKAKDPKIIAWCLITPNSDTGSNATITETDWSTDWSFSEPWFIHCESKDGSVIESMWPFPMGAFNALGGKGKSKDRGMFWLGPFEFPLVRGSSGTFQN